MLNSEKNFYSKQLIFIIVYFSDIKPNVELKSPQEQSVPTGNMRSFLSRNITLLKIPKKEEHSDCSKNAVEMCWGCLLLIQK